ncbi:hypothetical protein BVX98_07825, partial [bacterium F11]
LWTYLFVLIELSIAMRMPPNEVAKMTLPILTTEWPGLPAKSLVKEIHDISDISDDVALKVEWQLVNEHIQENPDSDVIVYYTGAAHTGQPIINPPEITEKEIMSSLYMMSWFPFDAEKMDRPFEEVIKDAKVVSRPSIPDHVMERINESMEMGMDVYRKVVGSQGLLTTRTKESLQAMGIDPHSFQGKVMRGPWMETKRYLLPGFLWLLLVYGGANLTGINPAGPVSVTMGIYVLMWAGLRFGLDHEGVSLRNVWVSPKFYAGLLMGLLAYSPILFGETTFSITSVFSLLVFLSIQGLTVGLAHLFHMGVNFWDTRRTETKQIAEILDQKEEFWNLKNVFERPFESVGHKVNLGEAKILDIELSQARDVKGIMKKVSTLSEDWHVVLHLAPVIQGEEEQMVRAVNHHSMEFPPNLHLVRQSQLPNPAQYSLEQVLQSAFGKDQDSSQKTTIAHLVWMRTNEQRQWEPFPTEGLSFGGYVLSIKNIVPYLIDVLKGWARHFPIEIMIRGQRAMKKAA